MTYNEEQIATKLSELGLDQWYYEDKWLRRKVSTDGWQTTLQVVNVVGFLCEAAYHHADLAVTYAKLWIKLQTHSEGGITDKDFDLARRRTSMISRGMGMPTGQICSQALQETQRPCGPAAASRPWCSAVSTKPIGPV